MYNNELEVAKKAEQMLEASLRRKTSSFKDHVNRKENDPSLKDATAKAAVKRYVSKKSGQKKKYYMRSLSIKMARHGFIQNYGVDTTRSGGERSRQEPKNTSYGFKSHTMKMKAQPFINEAVKDSKVVEFVMENVTRIRAENLLFEVKRLIENPGT
ncbi:hypothetical protein [Chryseobacterium indologenes]|uniref:hypothetical protein n=1 Tax=Chryseobacterium indologenes TaxID=253 RepID=UPI00162AA384|nr:hypothetical protein [Chryseobacterium indologenes]